MNKLFGTDGVRGEAGSVLTPQLAFRLGFAAAYVLKKHADETKKNCLVIGRDTRISGDMLQNALVSGICAAGADAYCTGVIPTPAVAILTKKKNAMAGVVISASHNPFNDNGIKFFNADGRKLPDAIEDEIAQCMEEIDSLPPATKEKIGRVYEYEKAKEIYQEFIKEKTNARFDGLKVVVDCSNGAASLVAPEILRSLGADLTVIHNTPDGVNINAQCGSTHMESLQKKVVETGADLGLAYDGDADRLQAVDHTGRLIDGDQLLCIFAVYLKAAERLKKDTVVGTIMSNMGLEKSLAPFGIKTAKSKVGDRYVVELMEAEGAVLGGEQSGHIVFWEYNTTGDGILSSVKLLEIIALSKRSLEDLANLMEKYPQVLINVPVKNKVGWERDIRITLTIKKLEDKLGENGRILVRASGTENLLRVMVEGKDERVITEIAQRIAQAIDEALNENA